MYEKRKDIQRLCYTYKREEIIIAFINKLITITNRKLSGIFYNYHF